MIFQFKFPESWRGEDVVLRAGISSSATAIDTFAVATDGTYEKSAAEPNIITSYWYHRADGELLTAGVFTPDGGGSGGGGLTEEEHDILVSIDDRLTMPNYSGPIIAAPAPPHPDLVNVYVTLTKGFKIALGEVVTAKVDQSAPVFLESGLDVSREVSAIVEDVEGHTIAVLQLPKSSALAARQYIDTVIVSAPGNPPIRIRVADESGTLESMVVE